MRDLNEAPLFSAAASDDDREEDFSLVALMRLLWNRRRFIFRTMLIGLVFSIAFAFLAPARYESTVSLMPPDPHMFSNKYSLGMSAGIGGANAAGTSALASSLMGETSTGDLFLAILQSHSVQNDIINRFGLMAVYHTKTYEDARKVLTRNTDAKEEAKSKVISITVTDRDPQRARAIANAYVDELDHLVSHLTTSGAYRERVFLEERLVSLKVELDSASQDLGQFSSKSGVLDVENQGKAMIEATARVQGELIAARSELSSLESIYTPDNERVRAAQARVGELETQVRKMGGVGHGSAINARTAAHEVYPSLRELPLMSSQYLDLSRKVKVLETVYEILTREYEMARIEEAKEIPSVKVLDAPALAERRSSPRRTLIVVVGLFIFFVYSTLIVYAEAFWKGMSGNDPRKLLVADMIASGRRIFAGKRELLTSIRQILRFS